MTQSENSSTNEMSVNDASQPQKTVTAQEGMAETGHTVAETGPFYYVAIDKETRIVQGWYQLFSPPTADNFIRISQADYEKLFTMPGAKVSEDGTLSEYVPPVSPAALKTQAKQAMQQVFQQSNMVAAMGETFGPKMREYVQQIRAIIDGKDDAPKTLPSFPDDPTE